MRCACTSNASPHSPSLAQYSTGTARSLDLTVYLREVSASRTGDHQTISIVSLATISGMDARTSAFYDSQAQMLADRYEGVPSPVEPYFPMAFNAGARVLDIGCGSGRDIARLLADGYDAFGIEPTSGLRGAAVAAHPELAGRLLDGSLPDRIDAFGGDFDGVLCSAVLMHVPDTELLDAALAIRAVLKPQGKVLLSLPTSRPDAGQENRDINGRLFAPYTAEEISLLFERLGFQLIHRWDTDDSFGRGGIRWFTLLLALRDTGTQRPIDQIETILNRDRKEATYKLALFRALAEVATQEARTAVWCTNGKWACRSGGLPNSGFSITGRSWHRTCSFPSPRRKRLAANR